MDRIDRCNDLSGITQIINKNLTAIAAFAALTAFAAIACNAARAAIAGRIGGRVIGQCLSFTARATGAARAAFAARATDTAIALDHQARG